MARIPDPVGDPFGSGGDHEGVLRRERRLGSDSAGITRGRYLGSGTTWHRFLGPQQQGEGKQRCGGQEAAANRHVRREGG